MTDFELEMIDEGLDADYSEVAEFEGQEEVDDPILEYQAQAMNELAREARA